MEVTVPGQPKVTYGGVNASRARQIVAQHVVNNVPVLEWAINVEAKK